MNSGKQLYDLQQIDLDLEDETERLSQVESQLSDNKALTQAQAELEGKRNYLAELEKKQKNQEWKVEDLQAKLSPLQKKLYAGSVKNPKELLSLQQQVADLKTQIRSEEDGVLEIMSQVEGLQKEIASKAAVVEELKEEWQKRQEELTAVQAELKVTIDIAEQKRSKLATTIEPIHLELYETLRAKKQGQAVAKVEQGRCQGCRITLPMSELQRARMGELVQCSSCSRVLCLG
ncbi:MAG TPA: C4-type zinc ribbon domain-containing protein [Dehalococcoidia bacterium]|nr:C4-type zinc ribbon domain-containing protein [Dehalococcoidia bacterium]